MKEVIEVKGSFDSARFIRDLKRKAMLNWLISVALALGIFVLVRRFSRSEFEFLEVVNLLLGCTALSLIFYLRVKPNLSIGKWTRANYLSNVQLNRETGWEHWEMLLSGIVYSVHSVKKYKSAKATFIEFDGITFLALVTDSQIYYNGKRIDQIELEQLLGLPSEVG